MKSVSILVATLALPASLAFAQTPAPTTGSTSSIPYIPLIGSSGASSTSNTSTATAWFIDTANKLVVFCAQSSTATTSGAPNFACTAQPVPTTATGATPPATTQ
ncbi:hypothetical protein [Noviherbaspirillum sp.]|uniref:hypothetical protein n=1 Tax=Noviherbaspirillum sp. TaxID=1926288 RepID=UPI0025FD7399|nr:hypothetical protein [Noviherbaspirillum sp.]